ncbi:MAG: hypothetical protein LWW83_07185 [Azonexaceae bacterium]|nr:hypothetical protein [Azonexaceae bacterium]
MHSAFKILLFASFIAPALAGAATSEISLQTEKPALAMNAYSEEARIRSSLFESIAHRYGFSVIEGRFGGEYNNDQLALKEQNGRTLLLLGLKATGPKGDLQLDQMSMGPFLQFSSEWLSAVIQSLKLSRSQYANAAAIEQARNSKSLDLVVLLFTKGTEDVKFLGITTPE